MSEIPSPFSVRRKASVTDAVPDTLSSTPSDNFDDKDLVGMTFNMPREWHTRFKMCSVQEGISMRELLFRSFEAYLLRSK